MEQHGPGAAANRNVRHQRISHEFKTSKLRKDWCLGLCTANAVEKWLLLVVIGENKRFWLEGSQCTAAFASHEDVHRLRS